MRRGIFKALCSPLRWGLACLQEWAGGRADRRGQGVKRRVLLVRVIQFSAITHAYPGSAGVSPAPEAAKMAALPGKARQVLAQTGKLHDPATASMGVTLVIC